MKLIKLSWLLILIFSTSSFSAQQKVINEGNLYGSWNCKHKVEGLISNLEVKVDYNVNFKPEGQSDGAGRVLFMMDNFPELEYSLSDISRWVIIENNLILSSTQISSAIVSHPELDKFLNLKQFIPSAISESSKILKLTKNRLQVKSNGQIVTCSKNTLNS